MNKRTGVMILSIIGIVVGLGVAAWMAFGPDEIRLTRERIQGLIDEQLPYERDSMVISSATVDFSGDELVVSVDVNGERLGQQFSLSALTVGKPSYRNGSFYFVPSDLEFLNVVVGESDGQSLTDRLRGAAERYTLGNEGVQNLITDLAPGLETWLRNRTIRAAETILSRVPVYTLQNDVKGIAAKAVLGDVFVEDNELVITFTLWRLTWWVLMAIFVVLAAIAMLGSMVRNPGMFVAISLLPGDL